MDELRDLSRLQVEGLSSVWSARPAARSCRIIPGSRNVTVTTEGRVVETEAEFEHSIETVWRAMTDSEWLAVWFFPNDIEPVMGHKFTIWGRPIERWDGEFKCQVLAVEAPGKIVFRWYGGHEELKTFGRYMDTTVTWTLSALPGGGTRFHFVHEGFGMDPSYDALFEIMTKGSQSVLRSLAKRLPDLVEHGA
jgi:uncharacterized protein YndB with AHSA1/START domain